MIIKELALMISWPPFQNKRMNTSLFLILMKFGGFVIFFINFKGI